MKFLNFGHFAEVCARQHEHTVKGQEVCTGEASHQIFTLDAFSARGEDIDDHHVASGDSSSTYRRELNLTVK